MVQVIFPKKHVKKSQLDIGMTGNHDYAAQEIGFDCIVEAMPLVWHADLAKDGKGAEWKWLVRVST